MQHNESSIKVYYTKEYGRFHLINGNRPLNQTKINRIIRDIDTGVDLLRYCPIIVAEAGERLNVIDGQQWKASDFINCYSQLGNEHYNTLQSSLDRFSIPHTVAISLLMTGKVKTGTNTSRPFEQGKFQVLFGRQAVAFIEQVMLLNNAEKKTRTFLIAIETVINAGKVKMDDFIAKINSENEDLKWQPDSKSYLTAMETIYNKGKHSRITIY